MKLLGTTKSKVTKDENAKNVPYLEITEVEIIHSNGFNNSYQKDSRVWYISLPSKSSGQLLSISRKKFVLLKTFDS